MLAYESKSASNSGWEEYIINFTIWVLGVYVFMFELAVACWSVHCLGGLGSCVPLCLVSNGNNFSYKLPAHNICFVTKAA